ncbi:hypothetical protein JCM3766R1_004685 [Sporobolomyces carnicolor]
MGDKHQRFLEEAVRLALNDDDLTSSQSWIAVARVMIKEGVINPDAETHFNVTVGSWVLETEPEAYKNIMEGVSQGRSLAQAVADKSGRNKWLDFLSLLLQQQPWGDDTPETIHDFWITRNHQSKVDGVKTQQGILVVPLVRRGGNDFFHLDVKPARDRAGNPNLAILDTVPDSLRNKDKPQADKAGEKTAKRLEGAAFSMQLALAAAGHDGTGFKPTLLLSSPDPRPVHIKRANLVQEDKKTVSTSYTKFLRVPGGSEISFEGECGINRFFFNAWLELLEWQRAVAKAGSKRTAAPQAPRFCLLVSNVLTSCFTLPNLFQLAYEAKLEAQEKAATLETYKGGLSRVADELISIAWGVPANGKLECQQKVNGTSKDQIVSVSCAEGFSVFPLADKDGMTTEGALEAIGVGDKARREVLFNLCKTLKAKDKKAIYSGLKSSSSRWGTGIGAFGMTFH